jgi:hypothetical protein
MRAHRRGELTQAAVIAAEVMRVVDVIPKELEAEIRYLERKAKRLRLTGRELERREVEREIAGKLRRWRERKARRAGKAG